MSTSDPPARVGTDGAVRATRAVANALGAVLLGLSLFVVVRRFVYPTEGEWMTGAIRDGIERVRDGQPLYAAPSAQFIPFVYPPLYFWVSAVLARVVSSFIAGKLVSIAASLATGWAIYRIGRVLGATPAWSRTSLLLHVASYSLTILFYDLERVDALYAALSVVAVAVLLASRSTRSDVLAGLLLGLAFFAKQAGLFTFAAAIVGLVACGERKRAGVVLAAGLGVLVAVGAYLQITTDGWFGYYALKLPRSHGVKAQRLSVFFIHDIPKAFLYSAASLALSVPLLVSLVRRWRRAAAKPAWQDVVFAGIVGASMLAAFSFRAHSGGWENVLVTWLPFGSAAFAVVATRADAWARGTRLEHVVPIMLYGALGLQMMGAMFDPLELSPDASDYRERERLTALVRKLEEEGPVLVTTTGHLSKQTSVHAAALWDVLRAGDRAPADLLQGLEQRRYAAIFVGKPDELDCGLPTCDELESVLIRSYFIAGRRHERERNGMSGYDARPRWLLRPRKNLLPATLTRDELFLHQRVEKGFAEMKSAQSDVETEITPSDDIEAMTARELGAR